MTEAEVWQRVMVYDGTRYEYIIRRSQKAQHLSLRVDFRRGIEVVLPRRMSVARAEEFVWEKREWLKDRAARFMRLRSEMPKRQLVSGELLPLLGRDLRLLVVNEADRQRSRVSVDGGKMEVRLPSGGDVRDALARWYRQQARKYFSDLVIPLAQQLDCQVASLAIGDHRTQWGSCGTGGRLSFNWRLMLAPEAASHYVAAHEVAHLKHHNHSHVFWQTVALLYPEYSAQRRWLKQNEHLLIL